MDIKKFVAHSKTVLNLAKDMGWNPAARYTNLRDLKHLKSRNGIFIDIDWKNYNFEKHLLAVTRIKPLITVARDIIDVRLVDTILHEAEKLSEFAKHVILVPKDKKLSRIIDMVIPKSYLLGYSVPTQYGKTFLTFDDFQRPTHLLGGRPDIQRKLADFMPVVSFDCNRFTYDARYGDYFDGDIFRPHPKGGYRNCLRDSLSNINKIWEDYKCSEMIEF